MILRFFSFVYFCWLLIKSTSLLYCLLCFTEFASGWLELTRCLAHCPTQRIERIERIRICFLGLQECHNCEERCLKREQSVQLLAESPPSQTWQGLELLRVAAAAQVCSGLHRGLLRMRSFVRLACSLNQCCKTMKPRNCRHLDRQSIDM